MRAIALDGTLKASPSESAADILILATPTWLGQISSEAKRALERMEVYRSTDDREWTHETGRAAANLVHAARALGSNPIPKPPDA
jgi:multimeric flavodoxin WrbA